MRSPFKKPTVLTVFRDNFDFGKCYVLLRDNLDGTGVFIEKESHCHKGSQKVRDTKPVEVTLNFNSLTKAD